MRVLIASSYSPLSNREEGKWTTILSQRLGNKGMQIDNFMLPFVNNPLLIPEQMMALRLLDVEKSSDLLITIGYPAFVLKHPHKRVFLFSLASSLHEHFNTEYGILSTPQYQRIRDSVHRAERKCLAEAERIVCASETLATQIRTQHNLAAQAFICDDELNEIGSNSLVEEGGWVVCESTLEPADRIDLLLNAVAQSTGQWRLMICVPSASQVYRDSLFQRIERLGLKERVRVVESSVSVQSISRKAHVFVALPFTTTRIPESLLWAAKSGIPVLTATDCGAILEVIHNEKNGLVVEPSAQGIARGLDLLVSNSEIHKRLSYGYARSSRKHTSVDELLEKLVQ